MFSNQTPVLAYADYSQPFQLHTDASKRGLGAVLYQDDDDGERRVVASVSHSSSHSEKQYLGHKLEFLTFKWAITDRYHEYLYGRTFDIYTNNKPLTYKLTMHDWTQQAKDGSPVWLTLTSHFIIEVVKVMLMQMLFSEFLGRV